jgi:hypothetical protein
MIEAFEIGVSIALSGDLSTGLAKAQREIECLQNTAIASKLTLETIRKTATQAMSVSGLSRQDDRTGYAVGSIGRGHRPALELAKENANATHAANQVARDGDKAADSEPGYFPSENLVAHKQPEPPQISAPEIQPSNLARVSKPAQLREDIPKGHDVFNKTADTVPVEFLAPSIAEAARSGLSSTPELVGKETGAGTGVDAYSDAGLSPVPAGQRSLSAAPTASDSGQFDQTKSCPVGGNAMPYSNRDSPCLISFAVQDTNLAPGSANTSSSLQNYPTSWLFGGPAAPRVVTADSLHEPISSYPRSGELQTRITAEPQTSSEQRGSDGNLEGDKGHGPPQGDVFLDGVLVGRWISRFLRTESERANNGPNGFNMRRSQLLPGVIVG